MHLWKQLSFSIHFVYKLSYWSIGKLASRLNWKWIELFPGHISPHCSDSRSVVKPACRFQWVKKKLRISCCRLGRKGLTQQPKESLIDGNVRSIGASFCFFCHLLIYLFFHLKPKKRWSVCQAVCLHPCVTSHLFLCSHTSTHPLTLPILSTRFSSCLPLVAFLETS